MNGTKVVRKEDGHRHEARIKLTLDSRTRFKLLELHKLSGYTVTALIRHCIDSQLPELEAMLKAQSPNLVG
jgi:hypothetical protein